MHLERAASPAFSTIRAMAGPALAVAAPAIAAAVYGWLVFATTFTHPGAIGPNHNAIGTDWAVYHGAAQSFLEGKLTTIFDGDRFTAFLNQRYGGWFSAPIAFRPWVYPPSYLLLLLPFGFLGLVASWAVFQFVTAAAFAGAVLIGARDSRSSRAIVFCGLACPAASINVLYGQNGFLSAAILIAGLRLLTSHPLLAGAMLGLMTIKPQFAILVPVMLLGCGAWRALFAAIASASVLVVASALSFGWDAWLIWLHQTIMNMATPDAKWNEYGRLWGDSVWACATLLGAAPSLASLSQLAFTLVAVLTTAIAFRRRLPYRGAILLAATLLAAPHWVAYDAVMLTVAGLYWLSDYPVAKRQTWPWIVMLALWLVPLVSPPILAPIGRFTPLLIAGFIAASMRRNGVSREKFAIGATPMVVAVAQQ